MHFFTKELWNRINSENEIIRLHAEKEWEQRQREYQIQFEDIKGHLSRRSVMAMERRDFFHDYTLLEVSLIRSKKGKYTYKLLLTNSIENVQIILKDINKAKVDISSFQNCIQGDLSWGYCEFGQVSSDIFSLSILCDLDNEMIFEFKSITLTCYKNPKVQIKE